MADEPKSERRFFVLILGVLIGFVIGFVVLLSRLPVDEAIGNFDAADVVPVALGDMEFEYYSVLPEQTAVQADTKSENEEIRLALVERPAQPQVRNPAPVQNSRVVPTTKGGRASYFLQAGAYQRADEAERARVELLRLGVEAFIVVRQDNRGNVSHRVRVGPFFDQSELSSKRALLRNGGIPFQIVRVTS